ncbi:aminodeoxychorismate lyase [Halopseudomonas nanhaiensis]|uniref:aminodeoxychorismate lyase n=1 Tax=Halopseudomonas nanhaiensis TaxID=2830842 RepID=UPI001CBF19B8|nr:aminodeoxychorismate lyase [Halopseudomonas nanhaiensis]
MHTDPQALCLVNGVPADLLPADDRGLAYGDGLFETVLVASGRATLLDRHLGRLQRGAERLKLDLDIPLIGREITEVAGQLGSGVLKLTVTRGSGPRGYRPPPSPVPLRIIQTGPTPDGVAAQRDGVRLFACETRLAQQPLLAGIKHLNRLEQVLARAEWQDGYHAEGLMCDTAGNLVEGTMSNIFLRMAQQWVTPDLSVCGIAGVMREYLIQALHDAGETVTIRHVAMDELQRCTELFCCNSVIGVWPVVAVGAEQWAVGAATRKAQNLAAQALG